MQFDYLQFDKFCQVCESVFVDDRNVVVTERSIESKSILLMRASSRHGLTHKISRFDKFRKSLGLRLVRKLSSKDLGFEGWSHNTNGVITRVWEVSKPNHTAPRPYENLK